MIYTVMVLIAFVGYSKNVETYSSVDCTDCCDIYCYGIDCVCCL